jgi:hypothetical protein
MVLLEQIQLHSSSKIERQRLSFFLIVSLTAAVVLFMSLMAIARFSLRTYFILLFISVLLTSEIFAPADPETHWWRYIRLIRAIGWLIFAYLIYERIAAII